MKTLKYFFAGALMLSISAQSMAQDVKSQIDAVSKVIIANQGSRLSRLLLRILSSSTRRIPRLLPDWDVPSSMLKTRPMH